MFQLGSVGTIGHHVDDLVFMKQTADRLLNGEFTWFASGVGRSQMRIAVHGALMGAHVRVGLDESINVLPGRPATGGAADAVRHISRILSDLGMQVATVKQAREILGMASSFDAAAARSDYRVSTGCRRALGFGCCLLRRDAGHARPMAM